MAKPLPQGLRGPQAPENLLFPFRFGGYAAETEGEEDSVEGFALHTTRTLPLEGIPPTEMVERICDTLSKHQA